MTDDVRTITADYDGWLAQHIQINTDEVADKHREMRDHQFRFLRGSYYLWLDRLVTDMPDALATARVPAIGDLHVENFGTWRDHAQVRRWGVNDLDELAIGPWLPDLLRLATSATIAPHVSMSTEDICRTVLTAYADAKPGPSLDLQAPEADDLRPLVPEFADPAKFYADLAAGSATTLPDDVVHAATAVAESGWKPTWHHHEAGTGSLGHRRAVGVGPADDGKSHAREAKQLGPGTAVWARGRHTDAAALPQPDAGLYERVRSAILGPDAAARVDDWHIRDLAPDVVRIQLTGQHKPDAARLLTAMAEATASVHGVDAEAGDAARQQASDLEHREFRQRVDALVTRTRTDFETFR